MIASRLDIGYEIIIIYLSISPPIYISSSPSSQLTICPSIYLSIYPHTHYPAIHHSNNLPTYQLSICPSNYSSIPPSIYSSVPTHLSLIYPIPVCLPTYPLTYFYPSIYPPIILSTIHQSIFTYSLFIYSFTQPLIHPPTN